MRSNNIVTVTGKVIQFKPKYTDGGKPRAFYQLELEKRATDGDVTFRPFIKSVGNQAKEDIENIHVGDIVTVVGRYQTRKEKKKIYLKVDENQEREEGSPLDKHQLRVIDLNDEYDSFSDDDEIFEAVIERDVAEIFAEDVDYVSDKLFKLEPADQARMISNSKSAIIGLLKNYKENNMTIDALIDELNKI